MARLGEFSQEQVARDKGVSRQVAESDFGYRETKAANEWMVEQLEALQKLAQKKSKKKGILGSLTDNILGDLVLNLLPGGQILKLADTLTERGRKSKDYKSMIAQLENMGVNVPSRFKGTSFDASLAQGLLQGQQQAGQQIQDRADVEKTIGGYEALLQAIPAAQQTGQYLSKIPNIENFTEGVKEYVTGALPGGQFLNKGLDWAGGNIGFEQKLIKDELTGEENLGKFAKYLEDFVGTDTIGVSPVDLATSFGKKPLIESMMSPPRDITMTEIDAPRRRIRV